MKKQPYVHLLRIVEPFTVWLVDGAYIRAHINEEFTNFGQHYRFPFIPKNEFWIDRVHHPREVRFFIDHLLAEYHAMAQGASYEEALGIADRHERAERKKTRGFSRLIGLLHRHRTRKLLHEIHIRKLATYSSPELSVWVIHSDRVRDLFFIDFTEGGHDKVYPFVPKNEIWLDEDLTPHERRFVLLHELHERRLMATKHWPYHKAHRSASALEVHCRRHPKNLTQAVQAELLYIQHINDCLRSH